MEIYVKALPEQKVKVTCIEDGRTIAFNRIDTIKEKIERLDNN